MPDTPQEQVYLLLGHSIIVGAANLGNVPGQGFDYLDDPIPGLQYAEMLGCPDDDGVGSCTTESGWATFDGFGSFGPELTFGRRVFDLEHRPARILKVATSGTGFADDWDPDATTGTVMWSRAIGFIDARLAEIPGGGKIAGVLLCDATNDSTVEANADAFEANYTAFITALRARYGNMRIVVSRTNIAASLSFETTTRAATANVARNLSNVAMLSMDGYGLKGDLIHPDTLGQIQYGEEAANLVMATTTIPTIRDQQYALIEALAPNSLSGIAFERFERLGDFREWAEGNERGSLRRVLIEETGSPEAPLSSNSDSEELATELTITVAYPQDGRYEADNGSGIRDVMREDMHQIDTAIGHRGYGSYVSGQNLADATGREIDESDGVSFVVLTYTVNYRRAY